MTNPFTRVFILDAGAGVTQGPAIGICDIVRDNVIIVTILCVSGASKAGADEEDGPQFTVRLRRVPEI